MIIRRLVATPSQPAVHRLMLVRGQDLRLDFALAPPEDITGWTISLQIAPTLGGTVSTTLTASLTDAARGLFSVTIEDGDTVSLALGRHVWDCKRTNAGNEEVLAQGTLDLLQEVTP
jgi:hypothetical protein